LTVKKKIYFWIVNIKEKDKSREKHRQASIIKMKVPWSVV